MIVFSLRRPCRRYTSVYESDSGCSMLTQSISAGFSLRWDWMGTSYFTAMSPNPLIRGEVHVGTKRGVITGVMRSLLRPLTCFTNCRGAGRLMEGNVMRGGQGGEGGVRFGVSHSVCRLN